MKSFTKIILCTTLLFSSSAFATENDVGLASILASPTAKRIVGVVSLVTALGFDAVSNYLARQSGRHEVLEEKEKEKKPVEADSGWSYYHEKKESKSSEYALGSWACWFGAKAGYLVSSLCFLFAHEQSLREKVGGLKNQLDDQRQKIEQNLLNDQLTLETEEPTAPPSDRGVFLDLGLD